jgi:hypothetical protein
MSFQRAVYAIWRRGLQALGGAPMDRGHVSGLARRAFERMLNWLSAFMSMQDFVFENWDLGRPPLGWREEGMPPWLDGLRPIFSLG